VVANTKKAGTAGKSKGGGKKPDRPLLRVEGLPKRARNVTPVGLTGTEAVSHPFELFLEVEVSDAVAAAPDPFVRSLFGRSVGIELAAAGGSRWFHGEVADVHLNETGGTEPLVAVLELRPALWRLSRSVDTRLYAGKTARQIIDAILSEHGLAGRYSWRLAAGHVFKERANCWQFRESDLDFVSRLLEEEGFRYWFEFSRAAHQLVLSNRPEELAACPEPLGLGSEDPDADGGRPCVSFLRRSWRATPASYVVRGRSATDPHAPVEGRSSDTAGEPPPGANGTIHDPDATAHEVTDCRTAARRRLDGYAAFARTAEGASNVGHLAAGRFVRIDARRPKPGANGPKPAGGTRYRLLAVRHDADGRAKVYSNRFDAAPADAPFAPPTRHPRPTVAGGSAAEVVAGPDEHGRYRLKFDLDRTGTASGWVPLAHPADVLFLPRVGERVSVDFDEGDPDRPVVRDRLDTAATFPFDPAGNSRLGGITTPAHKLWFDSADAAKWVLLEVAGRLHELVKGSRETVVEKDVTEKVLGGVSCTVEKSWAGKVGKEYGVEAKEVVFKASDRIVLTVGGSCIVIDSNGITINGAPLLHLNPPGGASAGAPAAASAVPKAPKEKPKQSKPAKAHAKPAAKAPAAPKKEPAGLSEQQQAALAKLPPGQRAALAKLPPDKQAAVLDSLTPWYLKPGGKPQEIVTVVPTPERLGKCPTFPSDGVMSDFERIGELPGVTKSPGWGGIEVFNHYFGEAVDEANWERFNEAVAEKQAKLGPTEWKQYELQMVGDGQGRPLAFDRLVESRSGPELSAATTPSYMLRSTPSQDVVRTGTVVVTKYGVYPVPCGDSPSPQPKPTPTPTPKPSAPQPPAPKTQPPHIL
jgi:type VI secretion system secreted protein VgrG